MPFALTVTPNPVNIFGTGAANAQTVTVQESGYVGPFTHTDTCGGNITITLTSATANGPSATYSVAASSAVTCDITFSDAFSQHTPTHVVVTTSGFVISGKKH